MRIIVGITGGIAAYKAPAIIRALSELGHQVKVIPTQNALRFIGSTTLEAISHNSVDSQLFNDVEDVKHIALAQEADLVLVAPATASFIARCAAGIADDLLSNVLLATKAKVLIAPAMHTEMWEHQATQHNISTLESRGVTVVYPGFGRLTGSDTGVGRLAETQDIIAAVLGFSLKQDYRGKSVLVVTGGTHEPIDSVRYIANRSSGKQGLALARAARSRGADVRLLAINLDGKAADFQDVKTAETAADVLEILTSHWALVDLILMPAAIGDFRVEKIEPGKLHRESDGGVNLHLISNPDILATLSERFIRLKAKPFVVGFAAHASEFETESIEESARHKLHAKSLDAIVANDISNGQVFNSETNKVLILSNLGFAKSEGTKEYVANEILDFILPEIDKNPSR